MERAEDSKLMKEARSYLIFNIGVPADVERRMESFRTILTRGERERIISFCSAPLCASLPSNGSAGVPRRELYGA